MSPEQHAILLRLLEMEAAGDDEAEIVCERRACWLGTERVARPDLDALLRLAALRDVSDVKGLQRFELNSTGRALARRPALADQVRLALLAGSFWTIVNDRIERL